MEDVLLAQTEAGVRTLTMNRPGTRNALDGSLIQRLTEELQAADQDDQIKVVVLTGADPAFCAGFDMDALRFGRIDPLVVANPESSPWVILSAIGVPVIGAINGPAVGNGLALALRCGFRVASERASFGTTNVPLGMHPGGGETALLCQAIGPPLALEMSLTGTSDFFGAAEAHQRGLVNRVVPHRRLLAITQKLAERIALADRAHIRMVNQLYRRVAAAPVTEGLAIEERGYRQSPMDRERVQSLYEEMLDRQYAAERDRRPTRWVREGEKLGEKGGPLI